MVSGYKKTHHRINGSHTGRKGEGIDAAFKGGHDFFQTGMGGIGFPGVVEAC